MKKLHILIPSLIATASMPFISMVGCKGESDEPVSTEHTITFSAGDHGTIEAGKETVVVKGDETKLGDIEKPTVIADEAHGWFFDHWDYDDSYVIKDDVTVTALYSDLSEYTIDMDQIESIIGLADVQYAQVAGDLQAMTLDIVVTDAHEENVYSPNINYELSDVFNIEESLFTEKYVYHSENEYWKKERNVKEGDWTEQETTQDEFESPKTFGDNFLQTYHSLIDAGEALSFNVEKKCYEGSWTQQSSYVSQINELSLYFKQNKIISFKTHLTQIIEDTVFTEQNTDIAIAYEEIIPDIPN